MQSKTAGHLAGSGGVRGHSAGDIFPYVIYAQGTFDSLVWHIKGNGADRTLDFASYDFAHEYARAVLLNPYCQS